MHINFGEIKASQYINYNDGVIEERISLIVELPDQDKISIGADYLFANTKTFKWYGKDKKEVQCGVSIGIDSENTRHILKDGSVGIVGFNEDYDSGDGEYFSASIFISIYINEQLFNKIITNIHNKLFISNFTIEVTDDSDEVKYGWEPDSSHIIWANPKEKLYLKSFDISFVQNEPLDADVKANLVEAQKENDACIKKLYGDINANKTALYVIALIVIAKQFI